MNTSAIQRSYPEASELRVLITGAGGIIGRCLRADMRGRYKLLRLMDVVPQEPAGQGEELCDADMLDPLALDSAMTGIDCVVHLAGIPTEAAWESILPVNIEGCYNVFEAARRQGVTRVVFASSNHTVGFHRRERFIDDRVELRPDTRYGVSKVFGEALGRLYADKHGLSVACMRIGTFLPDDRPTLARQLLTWISHRDMAQLARRCVEHPRYHFVIVYGVSDNLRNRWDNYNARFLGFRPEDDAEELHAARVLAEGGPEDPLEVQFHGGFQCATEFTGNPDRID